MPGKTKRFRYHLVRVLSHPQLPSLVFAILAIVAWVHWRKVIGELKVSPWAAAIFLGLIFRSAIVEFLGRTEEIQTPLGKFSASTKELKEEVEKADVLSAANNPKPIIEFHYFGHAQGHNEDDDPTDGATPFYPGSASRIKRLGAELLEELPDISAVAVRNERNQISIRMPASELFDMLRSSAALVLRKLEYSGPPHIIDSRAAEFLTFVTGLSGWNEVAEVWESTEARFDDLLYEPDAFDVPHVKNFERSIRKTLWSQLAYRALTMLRQQIQAMAKMSTQEDP